MKRILIIVGLTFISILIYCLQIVIFKDPSTTYFYIFQDLAFIPISIAITFVVVGRIMTLHEQRDARKKTYMLTSSFFTELGSALMFDLVAISSYDQEVKEILIEKNHDTVTNKQRQIDSKSIQVSLSKTIYQHMRHLLEIHQTELLVIASNPLLLDQECFVKLLWSIFHLLDEFRLRGHYDDLSKEDIEHLNSDLEHTFKLLIKNYVVNNHYLKKYYPSYYHAAISKLQQ